MEKDIFAYSHYKPYLNAWLDDPQRGGGHGSRARLAAAVNCQTSYVAQVLKGSAHFSLEQIESINDFCGHDEIEGDYLLLLVQWERAGSSKLKARFQKKLDEILESRLLLKNRLGVKQTLSQDDRHIYYGAWYYAAIHVMASQPQFNSVAAIASRLHLDSRTVNEALHFLITTGLIEKKGNGFRVGMTRLHLGSDSPLISKHHINWRLQAIRALEKSQKHDLFYSSVVTVSEKDILRLREMLTKTIQEAKAVIKESPEEKIQCLNLDFFEI